jgi:tetratricopeptide (TPR) repeat protein
MKSLLALAAICALLFGTACTQNSQKLLANGNKYHQEKKYKEASILYRKAIAKDKTNAEAYYREGLNLLDQNNPFEASKFLRRAVDLKPDNTDAEAKLAEIYLLIYTTNPKKFKSLLSEVRELTSKVLQREPNSFDGIRLQAFLYLTDKNIDKALANFEEANRIRPYSRQIVGWYAEALVAAKRPDDADTLTRDMIAHDKTWGPGYDFLFLQYKQQNNREKAEAVLRERVTNDPSSPTAITNLANYLLATDRFTEAELLLGRVIDDKKSFPNGREILGDFYLRARKFDQALEQYQAGAKAGAKQDQKNALQYDQRIVTAYSMMGRRDDAIHLAKELAEKNPKDNSTNQIYAVLLLETGLKTDAAKSLAELKSLVQKNPSDATLHLYLARAYLSLNENDKSLSEALEAIREQPNMMFARVLAAHIYEDRGQHPKALDQTELILAANPSNPDARLVRDRALIGLNEADRALPELEALLQQYPQMNDARYTLANLYLTENQYVKASGEFQGMWSSNPPDNRGFIGLQTVKLAQGKGEEAVRAVQEFVDKNPNAPAYRYQLANLEASAAMQVMKSDPAREKTLCRAAAGNYKEILRTEASAAPSSTDVWLRLGVMQRELAEYEAALASFEQAGSTNPRSADAFLNQAMLLDALARTKEAIDAYNKVLGIDPENSVALNNVAFLNAQAGANLDQAMTFAERAKKKYPKNPEISDTLGFVYFQKNLNVEALRIFRQVVEDEPKNATFHLHLAMALLKQGDKQGARDEAGRALKNASQPDEQTKIRSFVSQIG